MYSVGTALVVAPTFIIGARECACMDDYKLEAKENQLDKLYLDEDTEAEILDDLDV